ncbi:MAG TPA: PAS domain-containing protein, partial [Opitutaceae bacterium]|nr:PAS domain-containing protein [Opitutaceae bacterium]
SEAKQIEIDVTPIDTVNTKERFYLILFVETGSATSRTGSAAVAKTKPKNTAHQNQLEQLNQDLQSTRSYLQTIIEKHESTNQELRAANEEIQSSNEELQSTNEELETAKEELQSTNEELTTVNEELHSRQLELIQVNNDLHNLINSVHLPIIILGQDMRIRRFTPMAERVLNVIPTDIGRPLSDINTNLNMADLPKLMAEVVESLMIKELEVQDNQGYWYSMRLRPYKTADNKIDGIVITLIDIDQMKRTIGDLEETRNFVQAIVETIREPLIALNDQLRVRMASDAFYRLFQTTKEHTIGRPFLELVNNQSEFPRLRERLEGIVQGGQNATNVPIIMELSSGRTRLHTTVRQIVGGSKPYPLILLTFQEQREL